jgi:hypothetical protein
MTDRPAGPGVMPIDRERWKRELNLSNFVNAYYQYRDLLRFEGCRRVLIIGPGQGLQTEVLKWRGFDIVTIDVDETFSPDVCGSVHDMHMFDDRAFDAAIASHVLEHLPVSYLDGALNEIARVAAAALIYVPVAGRHFQARLQPGFKDLDLAITIDLFDYLHRPSGEEARYCQQQHYWEAGMRGFRTRDLRARMSKFFDVLDVYRNRDWNPSLNFVLASRGGSRTTP